ncbi:MAG: hypothetical protein U1E62_15995 [Alsobacter sp.]
MPRRAGLIDAVTPQMTFDDVEERLADFLAALPDRPRRMAAGDARRPLAAVSPVALCEAQDEAVP